VKQTNVSYKMKVKVAQNSDRKPRDSVPETNQPTNQHVPQVSWPYAGKTLSPYPAAFCLLCSLSLSHSLRPAKRKAFAVSVGKEVKGPLSISNWYRIVWQQSLSKPTQMHVIMKVGQPIAVTAHASALQRDECLVTMTLSFGS